MATENVSSASVVDKNDEWEKAISVLQAAITDGVDSGKPQRLDVAAFKLRMRKTKQ